MGWRTVRRPRSVGRRGPLACQRELAGARVCSRAIAVNDEVSLERGRGDIDRGLGVHLRRASAPSLPAVDREGFSLFGGGGWGSFLVLTRCLDAGGYEGSCLVNVDGIKAGLQLAEHDPVAGAQSEL